MRSLAASTVALALLLQGHALAEMRASVVTGSSATVEWDNTLWSAGRVAGSQILVFQCIHGDCGGKGVICNATADKPKPGEAMDSGSLLSAMKTAITSGAVFPGGKVISVTEQPRAAMVGDNMGALVSLLAEHNGAEYDIDLFQTGADGKLVHSMTCLAPAGAAGAWERQMLIGGLKLP